jgi:hypothetical protein
MGKRPQPTHLKTVEVPGGASLSGPARKFLPEAKPQEGRMEVWMESHRLSAVCGGKPQSVFES